MQLISAIRLYHSSLAGGIICLGMILLSFMPTVNAQAQDFYHLQHVPEAKVYFEQTNWAVILDSLKQSYDSGEGEDRLIARMILDNKSLDSVGVRFKGNSSYFNVKKYNSGKLPFNIKLDHFIKKQTADGVHQTLKLSNLFRDPSFLREVLAYEVAGKYMVSPKANFLKLYINDQYQGLYNNTESVDKDFLQTYFGDAKGAFFKCDPNWKTKPIKGCPKGDKASLQYLGDDPLCYEGLYELKSKKGWKELIRLTQVLNKNIDSIESILNVDATLWMLAFNNVTVNLDSYIGRLCHNYYLYQDSFGIFHPIVWDMNLSFGGFRFDGSSHKSLSNEDLQTMSPFIHYKNPARPLISQLLQVDLYRKIYLSHIRTILEENFKDAMFTDRIKRLQQQIDLMVQQDENKLYTYDDFLNNLKTTTMAGKSKIIGLTELMDGRTAYLMNHPLLRKTFPTIEKPAEKKHDKVYTLSTKVSAEATQVYLCYRDQKFEPFSRVKMHDDGAQGDKQANDGVWTVEVNKEKIKQYYIIAEAEKVASVLPKRAAQEFFTIQ